MYLYLPSCAVCIDAQLFLYRYKRFNRICFRFHQTAAHFVINSHRITIGGIILITLYTTVAAIYNNLPTKVWTGFHFDLRGLWQALCSLCSN